MEVYVWGLKYNSYISPDNVIKDYSVLCWSAKWLFEPEVMGEKVTGKQAINREDADILTEMWRLLNEADIVVVQNGKKFDIPKLNSRFLLAGFPPPMYYQVVDTKEVMAKHFGFSSNKLDYVNGFLGLDCKDEMEFQDWIDCVHGSEEALAKMLHYNKDDVVIMEELYLKLRPWIPGHANLGGIKRGVSVKKNNAHPRASGLKMCNAGGLAFPTSRRWTLMAKFAVRTGSFP